MNLYAVNQLRLRKNCASLYSIRAAAEGMILGTAAKMFTIAGPVIVYGVSASVVYGLIYWITTLF